jgi:hypothetical protein
MNSFLTLYFSGYPAAKNLIPVLSFNYQDNQRGALLQKNVENCLISNGLSINKYLMG